MPKNTIAFLTICLFASLINAQPKPKVQLATQISIGQTVKESWDSALTCSLAPNFKLTSETSNTQTYYVIMICWFDNNHNMISLQGLKSDDAKIQSKMRARGITHNAIRKMTITYIDGKITQINHDN